MALPEEKQPKFDERVNEILTALGRGRTREELAIYYGYSTWKSLDIYMRRRNFTWDARAKTYVPAHNRAEKMLEDYESGAPKKVARIISLIATEGGDLRAIARQVGMHDHREMAEYMRVKGYEWSTEEGNYVKTIGELIDKDGIDNDADTEEKAPSKVAMLPTRQREGGAFSWEEYLPLLELLATHKEQLLDLLSAKPSTGKIPRFAIPGEQKGKSFYISILLARLIVEFSESKNVSQREIAEGAFIEYLQKYGFQREVDALLKRV